MSKIIDLSTEVAGIKLANPLMPASGPLVGDDEKMLYLERFGLGCMVTKTVSSKPAVVPRPCIYGSGNRIMNAELWSEHSLEEWVEDILPKLKKESNIPLIISAGYTKEDMEIVIPKLDPFADAFEISTHYVGKDPNSVKEVVQTIKKHTDKPVFMKVSPSTPDIVGFAKAVKEGGASGVAAINSVGPSMQIDLSNRKVLMGTASGEMWTSGPAIKPIALAIVNKIRTAMPEDFSIIGVGGVESAKDVLEFLLAGADAVQMLSAAMLKGKDLYKKIIDDLPKELEKYGFSSIKEVVETTLLKEEIKFEPSFPEIDNNKCVACGLCEKVCPYFAMKVKEEESKKVYYADTDKCFGCGLCQAKCPTQAIKGTY